MTVNHPSVPHVQPPSIPTLKFPPSNPAKVVSHPKRSPQPSSFATTSTTFSPTNRSPHLACPLPPVAHDPPSATDAVRHVQVPGLGLAPANPNHGWMVETARKLRAAVPQLAQRNYMDALSAVARLAAADVEKNNHVSSRVQGAAVEGSTPQQLANCSGRSQVAAMKGFEDTQDKLAALQRGNHDLCVVHGDHQSRAHVPIAPDSHMLLTQMTLARGKHDSYSTKPEVLTTTAKQSREPDFASAGPDAVGHAEEAFLVSMHSTSTCPSSPAPYPQPTHRRSGSDNFPPASFVAPKPPATRTVLLPCGVQALEAEVKLLQPSAPGMPRDGGGKGARAVYSRSTNRNEEGGQLSFSNLGGEDQGLPQLDFEGLQGLLKLEGGGGPRRGVDMLATKADEMHVRSQGGSVPKMDAAEDAAGSTQVLQSADLSGGGGALQGFGGGSRRTDADVRHDTLPGGVAAIGEVPLEQDINPTQRMGLLAEDADVSLAGLALGLGLSDVITVAATLQRGAEVAGGAVGMGAGGQEVDLVRGTAAEVATTESGAKHDVARLAYLRGGTEQTRIPLSDSACWAAPRGSMDTTTSSVRLPESLHMPMGGLGGLAPHQQFGGEHVFVEDTWRVSGQNGVPLATARSDYQRHGVPEQYERISSSHQEKLQGSCCTKNSRDAQAKCAGDNRSEGVLRGTTWEQKIEFLAQLFGSYDVLYGAGWIDAQHVGKDGERASWRGGAGMQPNDSANGKQYEGSTQQQMPITAKDRARQAHASSTTRRQKIETARKKISKVNRRCDTSSAANSIGAKDCKWGSDSIDLKFSSQHRGSVAGGLFCASSLNGNTPVITSTAWALARSFAVPEQACKESAGQLPSKQQAYSSPTAVLAMDEKVPFNSQDGGCIRNVCDRNGLVGSGNADGGRGIGGIGYDDSEADIAMQPFRAGMSVCCDSQATNSSQQHIICGSCGVCRNDRCSDAGKHPSLTACSGIQGSIVVRNYPQGDKSFQQWAQGLARSKAEVNAATNAARELQEQAKELLQRLMDGSGISEGQETQVADCCSGGWKEAPDLQVGT